MINGMVEVVEKNCDHKGAPNAKSSPSTTPSKPARHADQRRTFAMPWRSPSAAKIAPKRAAGVCHPAVINEVTRNSVTIKLRSANAAGPSHRPRSRLKR